LLRTVSFDLPESVVAKETRNVVYNIVHENQQRGVSKEVIEKQKEQIYSAASDSAKNRVKADFLLQKIAEKEDIKVSQEESPAASRIWPACIGIPPDVAKDLQKRNGIIGIYDQIANEKTLELLQQDARSKTWPPRRRSRLDPGYCVRPNFSSSRWLINHGVVHAGTYSASCNDAGPARGSQVPRRRAGRWP
jgi:trigger factor